jgi:hypothetical protein
MPEPEPSTPISLTLLMHQKTKYSTKLSESIHTTSHIQNLIFRNLLRDKNVSDFKTYGLPEQCLSLAFQNPVQRLGMAAIYICLRALGTQHIWFNITSRISLIVINNFYMTLSRCDCE